MVARSEPPLSPPGSEAPYRAKRRLPLQGSPLPGSSPAPEAPIFWYQGQAWYRHEVGDQVLYVSPTRIYMPEDGRFVERDPVPKIGGGNYAFPSSPTRNMDPLGLDEEDEDRFPERLLKERPSGIPEDAPVSWADPYDAGAGLLWRWKGKYHKGTGQAARDEIRAANRGFSGRTRGHDGTADAAIDFLTNDLRPTLRLTSRAFEQGDIALVAVGSVAVVGTVVLIGLDWLTPGVPDVPVVTKSLRETTEWMADAGVTLARNQADKALKLGAKEGTSVVIVIPQGRGFTSVGGLSVKPHRQIRNKLDTLVGQGEKSISKMKNQVIPYDPQELTRLIAQVKDAKLRKALMKEREVTEDLIRIIKQVEGSEYCGEAHALARAIRANLLRRGAVSAAVTIDRASEAHRLLKSPCGGCQNTLKFFSIKAVWRQAK